MLLKFPLQSISPFFLSAKFNNSFLMLNNSISNSLGFFTAVVLKQSGLYVATVSQDLLYIITVLTADTI